MYKKHLEEGGGAVSCGWARERTPHSPTSEAAAEAALRYSLAGLSSEGVSLSARLENLFTHAYTHTRTQHKNTRNVPAVTLRPRLTLAGAENPEE